MYLRSYLEIDEDKYRHNIRTLQKISGKKLTDEQLRSILAEMIEKKVTPTCPHGRPLVVAITHRELDRKFKRIQG